MYTNQTGIEMKPRDPNDIQGIVLSTNELLSRFTDASLPDKDSQEGMLLAASGFRESGYAHSFSRAVSDKSKESEDKRIGLEKERLMVNAARWSNFSPIGGIGFSFQNIMNSLFTKAKTTLETTMGAQQEKATINETSDLSCTKNGRTFQTREEIEQYGLRNGFDEVRNCVAIEETMMVDGVRMHTERYQDYLDMQATHDSLSFYQEQVETGQLDPRDLPDTVKTLLSDAQAEINPDVSFEEIISTPPVQVEAHFQDVINVVPTLVLTPK